MSIYPIISQDYDSNIYIILGEIPTIIDCGTGLNHDLIKKRIEELIAPTEIDQVILTHEHFDHSGGAKKIIELTNGKAKLIAQEKASIKIEQGKSEFAKMLGSEMPKIKVDEKLGGNEDIKIGDENYKVLHTPGHTPGCICLYNEKNKDLFSGDTIFINGSFGRYDFPGGSLSELINSITKLSKIDVKNIYPGHMNYIKGNGNEHISRALRNVNYYL